MKRDRKVGKGDVLKRYQSVVSVVVCLVVETVLGLALDVLTVELCSFSSYEYSHAVNQSASHQATQSVVIHPFIHTRTVTIYLSAHSLFRTVIQVFSYRVIQKADLSSIHGFIQVFIHTFTLSVILQPFFHPSFIQPATQPHIESAIHPFILNFIHPPSRYSPIRPFSQSSIFPFIISSINHHPYAPPAS